MSCERFSIDRLVAAGLQYLRDERYSDAADQFRQAIALLDAMAELQAPERVVPRAELVAHLAAALFGLGRLAESEPLLHAALAALDESDVQCGDRVESVRGALLFALGCCLIIRRALPVARDTLARALSVLRPGVTDLLRARTMTWLGSAMCMAGEVEAGLTWLQQAERLLDEPQLAMHLRERITVRVNVATAYSDVGHLDIACERFEQAEVMLEGMLSAAPRLPRLELARLRMNYAAVHRSAGRLDEAMTLIRAALLGFEDGIRRAPREVDTSRMRASWATLKMDLGSILLALDQLPAAAESFRASSRAFAAMVGGKPHLRADLARVWTNQAHLALAASNPSRAARLYRRAISMFDTMLGEGGHHLLPDRAQAALGLSLTCAHRGRVKPAGQLFDGAMSTLAKLTHDGQLQYAPVWLAGWQSQLSAWVERLSSHACPAYQLDRVGASLRRALDLKPLRGVGADDAPEALGDAATAMVGWCEAVAGNAPLKLAFEGAISEFLRCLLGWVADLLVESEPAWLERNAAALQNTMRRLRDAALAQTDGSVWLVNWFLHTHGLRAQRNTLTQGTDPRLMALHQQMVELRLLESDMLGSLKVDAWRDTSGRRVVNRDLPTMLRLGQDRESEQAARWCEMHRDLEVQRNLAVEQGWLPPVLRLDANAVSAGLGPRSALLLLAPSGDDGMLLVVLRHAPPGGAAVASHRLISLSDDLSTFGAAQLNLLARQALVAGTGRSGLREAAHVRQLNGESPVPATENAELDHFALEQCKLLWRRLVVSALRLLADEGVDDVCVLPADEWHLLPWRYLAIIDGACGQRLAVFPDAGAWYRCRVIEAESMTAQRVPSWAGVSWPAVDTGRALPWVAIEQALSTRLWNEAASPVHWLVPPAVCAKGIDSFIGMGHGASPLDNPARSGLALAGGEVLGAHDLRPVRDCIHVVMSSCVLGLTNEVFGEPLGFLSGVFDVRARFGVGWLVEVPDACACLFSMALQFSLRECSRRNGVEATPWSWSRVFDDTVRAIVDGRWPPGFVAWLAISLPAALQCIGDELGLPPDGLDLETIVHAPSPMLRRVTPWVTALGD